ncbi:uncharacterized protein L969DRAFT_105726 [Mixia osmundae IAM 14324]|uniref:Peroxisome assembly protein 12 n=1 Tax=Mixia osmundae (strain CBS 9802 / IAM 14324 / JCM 22182 / KY 12970) TaxID=764103 RepID=G7E1J6_MIXOS|nr:uncharacterized protein L969DRAFT_105726 [Mixia osmundae IAM 14324]KEI36659.1 hypothetical protein L969DRAFT_105726 [Mixia osmundae IAM 14324]GAA96706.1 hypothetical protein E5Q_03377 [Mixia osmundae IAM 14324]
MEFLGDIANGPDRYRPSFFELAAQEQLRELLPPVIKYILSVLAQRRPRYLLRIVNRHDEFYALTMYFVERYYLREWGASFAENFYGLKRRRRPGFAAERSSSASVTQLHTNHERLRRTDIQRSLLFLIGVPYVRAKAADLYEQVGGGVNADLLNDGVATDSLTQETRHERIARLSRDFYRSAYPLANLSYEVMLLGYNIAYIFDKTPYYRPWLSWMGVDVRRMSALDYRKAREGALSTISSPLRRRHGSGLPPSYLQVIWRYACLGPEYAFEALKIILPTSIFFFKFLEWWYSSDYARSRRGPGSSSSDAAIRPPTPLPIHPKGVTAGEKPVKGRDPLTGEKITNATALPSGWVYNYTSIHDYVEKHARCPHCCLTFYTTFAVSSLVVIIHVQT